MSSPLEPMSYKNLGSWLDLQYEIYFLVKTLNQLVFLFPTFPIDNLFCLLKRFEIIA